MALPSPEARKLILHSAGSLDGAVECWDILGEPRGRTLVERLSQVQRACRHPAVVECVARGWLVTTAIVGRDPNTYWMGTVDALLPAGVHWFDHTRLH